MEHTEYTCEENCIDMIRYAIENKEIPINESSEKLILANELSYDDQDLLIDNAYSLFNTYEHTKKLDGAMATLALLVSNYRREDKHNQSMLHV